MKAEARGGRDPDHRLGEWVSHNLPDLNREAEKGDWNALNEIVRGGSRRILATEAKGESDREVAEAAIVVGDIGMIVASLIRHGVGVDDSEVARMIRSAVRLSRFADHPPRDSVYTYVLWNGESGRSVRQFTGHEFEREFIRLSRSALSNYGIVAEAFRNLDIRSAGALAKLVAATAAVKRIQAVYQSLFVEPNTERPTWFRDTYKSYFPAYEIEGIEYDPPSGAHSPDVLEIDLFLGIVDEQYRKQVRRRLRHFISEDRRRVEDALSRPGVVVQLESDVAISGPVLVALSEFIRLYSRATAAHWALVHSYLITSGYEGDETSRRSRNVMSYDEVFRVMDLRRANPALALIQGHLESTP